MSLSERRRQFEAASKEDPLVTRRTKFHKLFGVSNSAKIIGRGLQLGVVNLDNVDAGVDSFAFACTMVFPPADEVYFTAYVHSDAPAMIERLNEMKRLGAVAGDDNALGNEDAEENSNRLGYAIRNNNVVVVLAADGSLHLRNQGFWDELPEDMTPFGPRISVDKINVALYPPAASARRSLLARDFIGYLGNLTDRQKIHELRVWTDAASVSPDMRRMPQNIPAADIEAAITNAGGHYPHGEVRRYHAAMNFLAHKHFVILSGLSGTGKTSLALHYARAVHGITNPEVRDPFIIVCAVRPEWTDPTGLTGFHDVLSNRYVVPRFLEAVLLATAHPDSPVFVVLDEMNLARVEYYFSDILSTIETREALQLHSNNVLEGTTGTSIRAELPLPSNLYITGTVNVDETTNAVSDKVLDRAVVIDMSSVDLNGFLNALQAREPALAPACHACKDHLLAAHNLMAAHGLGFGYRVAEEVVRYHVFAAQHLVATANDTTDDLMVQKVLIKLRGTEKQRPLLTGLATRALLGLPRSTAFIDRLIAELDDFGSFQASR